MDRRLVLAAVLLAACKAELANGPVDGSTGDQDGSAAIVHDAPPDGPGGLGAWATPVAVPGANTTVDEDDVTLSSNKLELYFKRNDATDINLYVMTRASTAAAWGAPQPVTELNTTASEESPRLTSDDLTMYFGRAGDIFKSTRTAVGQPWTTATAVTALNTTANEKWAAVCSNGYTIVSRANGTNLQDLYEGTIGAGANTLLAQLNTTTNEQGTFLSADCLTLYFQSNRNANQYDIFMATRTTTSAAWSNPSPVTDFNSAINDEDAWMSTDQRLFAFARAVTGNGKDLFISTR